MTFLAQGGTVGRGVWGTGPGERVWVPPAAPPVAVSASPHRLLELLLSRVRSSVHLQLACFQATPPPAVKTQVPSR